MPPFSVLRGGRNPDDPEGGDDGGGGEENHDPNNYDRTPGNVETNVENTGGPPPIRRSYSDAVEGDGGPPPPPRDRGEVLGDRGGVSGPAGGGDDRGGPVRRQGAGQLLASRLGGRAPVINADPYRAPQGRPGFSSTLRGGLGSGGFGRGGAPQGDPRAGGAGGPGGAGGAGDGAGGGPAATGNGAPNYYGNFLDQFHEANDYTDRALDTEGRHIGPTRYDTQGDQYGRSIDEQAAAIGRSPADALYGRMDQERSGFIQDVSDHDVGDLAGSFSGRADRDRGALNTTVDNGENTVLNMTRSALTRSLPQFQDTLQANRRDAIRRGVATGGAVDTNDQRATDSFERTIADAAAGQSANIWNTRVDQQAQMEGRDRSQSNTEADRTIGQRDTTNRFLAGLRSEDLNRAGQADVNDLNRDRTAISAAEGQQGRSDARDTTTYGRAANERDTFGSALERAAAGRTGQGQYVGSANLDEARRRDVAGDAGRGRDLQSRELDLEEAAGNRDYDLAQQNADDQRRSNSFMGQLQRGAGGALASAGAGIVSRAAGRVFGGGAAAAGASAAGGAASSAGGAGAAAGAGMGTALGATLGVAGLAALYQYASTNSSPEARNMGRGVQASQFLQAARSGDQSARAQIETQRRSSATPEGKHYYDLAARALDGDQAAEAELDQVTQRLQQIQQQSQARGPTSAANVGGTAGRMARRR